MTRNCFVLMIDKMEIRAGQEIGVFYYDNKKGSKATIEVVKAVTPSGYVTLQNGKRYTPRGKEINSLGPATHLCSVEQAQATIDKALHIAKEREERQQAFLATPEGRRKAAVELAVEAAIETLNQCGWYADEHGHMDNMQFELKKIIVNYVNNHAPVP